MKKSLRVMSAVLVASMLAACGNTAAPATKETTAAQEAAKENTNASAEEKVTLRLAHSQATDHLVNKTAERFAELVKEYSDGSGAIEIYPNSTFGSNAEMNAAVQSGDLDLYINASAQFAAQYEPITVVDAWYMFNDTDHLMKFYSPDCEVYQNLCAGLKEACNIDSLAAVYYGARHMTANVPFNSVSDLKGMKMRVASDPMPTAFFEAMGATPTPVAYNETYLALQQKVADGEENPAASITSMKFYEVQKAMSLTAHQYQMSTIYMSVPSEDKVSETQMEAIRKAATDAAKEHNAVAFDQEQEIIDALKDKIEIVTPADLQSFQDACASVYPKFEDTWGAGVADAIKAMA